MNRENLAYIRESLNELIVSPTIHMKPHKAYRCIANGDDVTINGFIINMEGFNLLFENAHERIMRHFNLIGLIKDGKPVNKTTFKQMANTVKYGKGESSFYVAYFYTHPKECMYRFAPIWGGGSKAVQMTNLYNDFIELVNGDMTNIDNDNIQFGNCGLPFGGYRDLATRWLDPNPKSIL